MMCVDLGAKWREWCHVKLGDNRATCALVNLRLIQWALKHYLSCVTHFTHWTWFTLKTQYITSPV